MHASFVGNWAFVHFANEPLQLQASIYFLKTYRYDDRNTNHNFRWMAYEQVTPHADSNASNPAQQRGCVQLAPYLEMSGIAL